jgi:uncharacterized linocin/CFP29 family protein
MTNDSQVPWTDEQWARVNQVIQEEASRARVAATFLPLYGPLAAEADFVRADDISYRERQMTAPLVVQARNQAELAKREYAKALQAGNLDDAMAAQEQIASAQAILERQRISINDKNTIKLATLQVKVHVRGAQMADPEMTSVLALFRRAANVLARLEDAVVFRGLTANPAAPPEVTPTGGLTGLPQIWEILSGQRLNGLWTTTAPFPQWIRVQPHPIRQRGERLVRAVSSAIGRLESNGHFGPFAVVLGQGLFLIAQTPDWGSLVLPQDRIIPFLAGGSLLRSSTLDEFNGFSGVVVALGGTPVDLVVATDVCPQFVQLTPEPVFLFRVYEKMVLRIKEPEAIIQLYMR